MIKAKFQNSEPKTNVHVNFYVVDIQKGNNKLKTITNNLNHTHIQFVFVCIQYIVDSQKEFEQYGQSFEKRKRKNNGNLYRVFRIISSQNISRTTHQII